MLNKSESYRARQRKVARQMQRGLDKKLVAHRAARGEMAGLGTSEGKEMKF